MIKWIDLDTVLEIHQKVIKSTGGSNGVRDLNALDSAIYSPLATFDKQELYPDIIEKVAVLLYYIVNNHPFIDGNKRTAFVVALTVFVANGYSLKFTQAEVIKFMLNVASGGSNYQQITKWFTEHLETK
ncbi:Death on curing protein, Doc toxin [Candidatus Syntrophocurvum alkaliphilum]|uniref:Death on curing protein, Doc toxin n=1 Tax=Candidatus Syntrophocurvum alkaliphilum TaxID=2293317 RepID=A0A6I6D886_9FIRM|nr:type II toxin-antitoxin system death-on-curing family toxin [Candidatus Syntrophocurvum alkaliphilum]QGT98797.1 Death on curing protein, Doc toxin [Candidatus Syntrophocurvum alkaliphilum]